jgi:hypothetical protein
MGFFLFLLGLKVWGFWGFFKFCFWSWENLNFLRIEKNKVFGAGKNYGF